MVRHHKHVGRLRGACIAFAAATAVGVASFSFAKTTVEPIAIKSLPDNTAGTVQKMTKGAEDVVVLHIHREAGGSYRDTYAVRYTADGDRYSARVNPKGKVIARPKIITKEQEEAETAQDAADAVELKEAPKAVRTAFEKDAGSGASDVEVTKGSLKGHDAYWVKYTEKDGDRIERLYNADGDESRDPRVIAEGGDGDAAAADAKLASSTDASEVDVDSVPSAVRTRVFGAVKVKGTPVNYFKKGKGDAATYTANWKKTGQRYEMKVRADGKVVEEAKEVAK